MVTGTGSIVFYSFPQEVVNQIAERTGGRPVTVEIPSLCDGEVEIDSEGRIFLVQPFTQPNGQVVERLIFMAQVTKTGEVFTDRDEKGSPVVLERVRKFPIKAGRSEIRNGKVIFPDTQQRPQLPTEMLRRCLNPINHNRPGDFPPKSPGLHHGGSKGRRKRTMKRIAATR